MIWECLTDLLTHSNALGNRIGQSWLLKLLVASAEREVEECRQAKPLSTYPTNRW